MSDDAVTPPATPGAPRGWQEPSALQRAAEALRTRWSAWRHLGPRAGTAAALRCGGRAVHAPVRRLQLRVRPARIAGDDLTRALGGRDAVAALRGPALEALPRVAAWERELTGLDGAARASLLARADTVAAHTFDLLGSGPQALGAQIDWQRDFKSGRSWPLMHISRIRTSYPDGSDIKVPWELSRLQHLPLLAGAYRAGGRREHLDELGAQLSDWIARNPVEFGATWACTMDVAIRAVNVVAALAIVAEDARDEPWLNAALASLLQHGRFIVTHLEGGTPRGNHYLSDLVGLLVVAAVFSDSEEGRGWAALGAEELIAELEHQVRPDGCDFEASISYHRLVAELFAAGADAVDALQPGRLPRFCRERLARMLDFVADYTRPDGLAPQMGDADDGRLLPLGDYGTGEQRSHLHLLRAAGRDARAGRRHAAYPQGGWYVMRDRDFYAIVRCGDVGLDGVGCHAHNDQLSFELALGDQPMVVDPGTYVYTADPDARNAFRSTAFHSTLRVGGVEQNEIPPTRLFALPDQATARALAWDVDGPRATFEGRHDGFVALDPPAAHRRRFDFAGDERTLRITDVVESAGAHALEWTFPLAPCAVEIDGARATARFASGVALTLEADGVDWSVEPGWLSRGYGVREPAPFLRGRRAGSPGATRTCFVLEVTAP